MVKEKDSALEERMKKAMEMSGSKTSLVSYAYSAHCLSSFWVNAVELLFEWLLIRRING